MIKTISIAALALAATAATAAPITYNVNQTIGLGIVIGAIQTSGKLGVLSSSDVLGFDLIVNGPGAAIGLTQATSIIKVEGNNFTASAKSLFFNYSGAAGYLLFQFGSFGTGERYYCNSSYNGACFQGASSLPESFDTPSTSVESRLGNQVIASSGAVPEPASWAMMVLGFGLAGTAVRRRSPVVTA